MWVCVCVCTCMDACVLCAHVYVCMRMHLFGVLVCAKQFMCTCLCVVVCMCLCVRASMCLCLSVILPAGSTNPCVFVVWHSEVRLSHISESHHECMWHDTTASVDIFNNYRHKHIVQTELFILNSVSKFLKEVTWVSTVLVWIMYFKANINDNPQDTEYLIAVFPAVLSDLNLSTFFPRQLSALPMPI